MRPDQQHGDRERKEADGDVLSIIAKHRDSHRALSFSDAYSAQEYPKLRDAFDAVAEYIAANDEYDAASKDCAEKHALRPDFVYSADERSTALKRKVAACKRRALAHARMKGEAK